MVSRIIASALLRKQSEEELVISETRFRSTFEQAAVGIAHVDTDGHWLRVNQKLCDIVGYTRDELLQLTFQDITHPEDLSVDNESRLQLLDHHIDNYTKEKRYIRKDRSIVWVNLTVAVSRKPSGEPDYFISVIEDISARKSAEEDLQKSYKSLQKTLNDAIKTMVTIVEMRDPYTAGHQQIVAEIAVAIAREMKLDEKSIENLKTAAIIHDIGKLYVPAEILSKPGKLTSIEISLVKVHAQSGYEILKDVELPYPIAEIVLQHHERLDGSGYPQGLKGDQILIEARIVSVADVVEATTSHRPYRPGFGIDAALEEIEKNKGILYDEKVVEVCVKLFREKGFKFEPTES